MAWTTPRTWVDGELVNAAIMNAHVRDNLLTVPHILSESTADQTVTSSTVLVNATNMSFSVGANETWEVTIMAVVLDNSDGVGNFKCGLTIPASTTYGFFSYGLTAGATASVLGFSNVGSGSTSTNIFGTTFPQPHRFDGVVYSAGTSGTVQFQFAQNTSNASGTVLKKGSHIIGRKQ